MSRGEFGSETGLSAEKQRDYATMVMTVLVTETASCSELSMALAWVGTRQPATVSRKREASNSAQGKCDTSTLTEGKRAVGNIWWLSIRVLYVSEQCWSFAGTPASTNKLDTLSSLGLYIEIIFGNKRPL